MDDENKVPAKSPEPVGGYGTAAPDTTDLDPATGFPKSVLNFGAGNIKLKDTEMGEVTITRSQGGE